MMSENAKDALWEVQKGAYAILRGQLSCKVYDEVPAKAAYPYVTFADYPPDSPAEARNAHGRVVLLGFNVWDRDSGGKQKCLEVIDEIVVRITGNAMTVTGFNVVEKHFLSSACAREHAEPGIMFRGTVWFRIWVSKST